jgi:hypothetical protein
MNKKILSFKKIKNYQKKTLPVYTHYVIDPISRMIVFLILKFQFYFKPYFYTYIGLLLAIISSYFFLKQDYIFGAIIFQISLIFDCIDGYVARIQNSGSIFGVMSDGFADFIKIFLNLLSLLISLDSQPEIFNFFNIYMFYILFENSINSSLIECKNYFKNKNLKKNFFDKKLITLKNKFENKNLRLVFFNVHEKCFLIFFVGPITDSVSLAVYSTIIISFIFLILKIFLDLANIKN